MAYLPESLQEQERRKQQEQGQGPQVASGASGVITGGAGGTSAGQPQGKGPSRSGSWTNLNAYLQNNTDQADQLGNRVAQNVTNDAEQAKSKLGSLQSQFTQKADQSSVNRNQGLVTEAVSNPTEFVKDQNKVSNFTKIRDAQYNGPQSLADVDGYTDTYSKLNNANQAVENTKTEGGRFSLIQSQFAKPSYSRGQQRLDQMLLQNAPGAREQFSQVQQNYGGLMGSLEGAQKSAQEYAGQRKAETQSAAKDVRDALGMLDDPTTAANEAAGAFGQFQTDLKGRTNDFRTKQSELYKRIQQALGGGQASTNPGGSLAMDADVAAAIGLQDGQRLYDVNLSDYEAQFNPDAINEQNVASADDYARYSALAQLAGQEPTYLYDQKNAGAAAGVQFDKDLLNQRIQDTANGQVSALRDSYNELAKNYRGYTPFESTNPEDMRQSFTNFINGMNQQDATWTQRADAGGGAKLGEMYRNIKDWLAKYDDPNHRRITVNK
jgi:hypothetical protein